MQKLIDIEDGWVAREGKFYFGEFLYQERLLDVITIRSPRPGVKVKKGSISKKRLPK
jgi:hypothetical protein